MTRATLLITLVLLWTPAASAQQTEIRYLSGTGNDHTVEWEFMVDDGRRAGEWASIPVPSQWELEGFGTYNYGHAPDSVRGKETGFYRHRFDVPASWAGKSIDLVFEGAMTDTDVRINGESAGPTHQGGFYRFRFDVSDLLEYGGENLLEVDVRKHSADESVNQAERHADYWIFGGIFRPVFLEVKPGTHIERTAIDARANGSLTADVFLENVRTSGRLVATVTEMDGSPVGEPLALAVPAGSDSVRLSATFESARPWSAEFPNRYRLKLTLEHDGRAEHVVEETFGFRTVEVRPHDGLYVNGSKVRLKGVNRHTFWPESGRTTSRALSLRDAELIKDMNMNAVRMSHYPPDAHFLDVADSLGLYILDELAGWQDEYDTDVGEKLVRELVLRDVNHPSVILWTNGNEGGFNFELEDDYARWDPQARTVLHPWLNDNGINTTHYLPYGCCADAFFGGDDLILPTEFLHGLYDGGHGAGLNDWWNLMLDHPMGAGGFLWVFADEAVVRTDRGGMLDTDGNHAPDGIVGPYREKEGSYFAIKEIWSPVYFEMAEIDRLPPAFDGVLRVENRFDHTNLRDVAFSWALLVFAGTDTTGRRVAVRGTSASPDVPPRYAGSLSLDLPADWREHDAIRLTAVDPHGREIYTWTWMMASPADVRARLVREGVGPVTAVESAGELVVRAGGASAQFDLATGRLTAITRNGFTAPLAGPRPVGDAGALQSLEHYRDGNNYVITASYDGNLREVTWRAHPSGWLRLDYALRSGSGDYLGVTFDYPEDGVRDVTWLGRGPYRVWKNRMKGAEFDVHHKANNDTVTGAEWEGYPEFKGFHADVYWAVLGATGDGPDLAIVSETENVFLRLFTPRFPGDARHAQVEFPDGDLSFLHTIAPIGTKFHAAGEHGPEGLPGMVFRRDGTIRGTVYFHAGGENSDE